MSLAPSCVILIVLKVAMAMTAMEMPIAMNLLGHPDIEISVLCNSALMMSGKSSKLPLMVVSLISVSDFVSVLKGSSSLSSG
jgi:hypothetical protein